MQYNQQYYLCSNQLKLVSDVRLTDCQVNDEGEPELIGTVILSF